MDKSKIDWCDSTTNPITGCYHNCPYCYARGITNRFASRRNCRLVEPETIFIDDLVENSPTLIEMNKQAFYYDGGTEGKYMCAYPHGFTPTLHRYRINEYSAKKRGRNIFVGSMADVFGEWVPERWIQELMNEYRTAPQHNYLFLTKNPARYLELVENDVLIQAPNFWYGTTVTDPHTPYAWFKDMKIHWFLSVEPILEPFGTLEGDNIPDWIIVGAETGNRKDKVIPERKWIEDLVRECKKYSIPIFMKSSLKTIWGEDLIQEFPPELRKRDNI